ncbi:MAG: M14 family zinc carboxypeptidase [Candidatus Hodarchaeota archaeon]
MTKLVILTLFLFSALPQSSPITVSQASKPVCIQITAPSVNRTWGYISLLYDDQFHDPVEVQEEIMRINELAPDLVDLEVIGQSIQGRNISCVRITNELNTAQKAKTLVVAQHHGREQITVEAALRFILRMVNGYQSNNYITHYVDTEEIYVIPMLNPDALELVVNNGNHWLRKNLRPYDNDNDTLFDEDPIEDVDGDGHISRFSVTSKLNSSNYYVYYEGIDNDADGLVNEDGVGLVDLNRNYFPFWGTVQAHHQVDSEVYAGTQPFSEPETRAFRDFATNHEFAMAYSLHSGINSTWFATNENGQYPYPEIYREMLLDLQTILPPAFNPDPGYIPPLHTDTLLNLGQGYWKDWMVFEQGCIAPMTFEIYHNASSDGPDAYSVFVDNSTHTITEWKGIYGYFNPEEQFINDLWRDIRPAFDYLLNMTPRLTIDIESVTGDGNQQNNVEIRFSVRNLSPHLGTIDTIKLLEATGSLLASRPALSAGKNRTDTINLDLSGAANPKNYTIQVGNEYIGYTRYMISFTSGGSSSPAFEYWIPLVLLSLVLLRRRMHYKRNKGYMN